MSMRKIESATLSADCYRPCKTAYSVRSGHPCIFSVIILEPGILTFTPLCQTPSLPRPSSLMSCPGRGTETSCQTFQGQCSQDAQKRKPRLMMNLSTISWADATPPGFTASIIIRKHNRSRCIKSPAVSQTLCPVNAYVFIYAAPDTISYLAGTASGKCGQKLP